MYKNYISIIFLCFILNASQKFVIIGDIVNIREKPHASSSIIGKLRMDDKFISEKEQNDWLYIDSIKMHQINGWVHKNVCGTNAIPFKKIKNNAKYGHSIHEKIEWTKKLIIREPDEKKHWNHILDLYLKNNDKLSYNWVKNKIEGKLPIFIAINDKNAVRLAGMLDSNNAYKPLEVLISDEITGAYASEEELNKLTKKLETLRLELSSIPWFYDDGSLCNYWFPKPIIKNSHDYNTMGDCLYGLELGRFLNSNKILISEPFVKIKTTGVTQTDSISQLFKFKKQLTKENDTLYEIKSFSFEYLNEYNTVQIRINNGVCGIFTLKDKKIWPTFTYNIFCNKGASCVTKYTHKNFWYKMKFSTNNAIYSFLDVSVPPHSNVSYTLHNYLFSLTKTEYKIHHIREIYCGD